MNNFVFSQDPLLYSSLSARQNVSTEYDMKRQLDEAIAQYQAITQQQAQNTQQTQPKDYLGEIDDMIRGLDEDVALILNGDIEYLKLNEELQRMVQEEMMKSVKWKINNNNDAVSKMERLKVLISNAQKSKNEEDRKVMADINDYIKNYSDLTFEEYKELKYGKKS